jgi:DNA mismatch repair protein MutH
MSDGSNYYFSRPEFNRNDKDSVLNWAHWLKGKSLQDSYRLLTQDNKKEIQSELEKLAKNIRKKAVSGNYKGDKGIIGQMVEMVHFGLKRNSRKGADLAEAGLELKTTGIELNPKSGHWEAKERLTLTQINYEQLLDCSSETDVSIVMKGLNNSLIIVYFYFNAPPFFYEPDEAVTVESMLQTKFAGAFLWKANNQILLDANRDWRLIKAMCESGYAHMISERYSAFLGCAPRGMGSRKPGKEDADFSAQTVEEAQGQYALRANCQKLGLSNEIADEVYASITEREKLPRNTRKGYALPPPGHHKFEKHGKYPRQKRAFTIPDKSLTRVILDKLDIS